MKKKLSVFLLVILVFVSGVYASDWHFVFGDITQHPEILFGFIPSYVDLGIGYKGFSILDDNTTDIQFLVGGGFNQRKLWQNPETGDVITSKPLIYDVIDFDWSVRFLQGFLSSPMGEKDLITLSFMYNGQFERARDSIVAGKTRFNGKSWNVQTIDQFFSDYESSRINPSIYPEINGNRNFLGTQFALNLKIDAISDTVHENNGVLAKVNIAWGPKVLNSSLDGYADYFTARVDLIGAYTVYNYTSGGKSWFSITLIDRANFGYVTGDAVPAFIQGPESLGRKVRGFDTYSYNTELTVVNNFDIRLAGPDLGINGIAPRINIFFDMGYGWGRLMNTDIYQNNFLASTGVQGTVTFFDFIDLGYQIAYLISGNNYSKGSDKRVTGKVTFFLDF